MAAMLSPFGESIFLSFTGGFELRNTMDRQVPSNHLMASGIRHVFAQDGQRLTALDGIDLALRKGEFLSLIGASGCGKTTLLRILGGLLEPTEGSVSIEGEPPGSAQQRKAIGYVFQEAALVPWRTVEENIRLPLEIGGNPSFRKDVPF